MAKRRRVPVKCAKCGKGMTMKTEMRMVIDLTWYPIKHPKYKTWRAKICTECLKEFAPIIKQFGFSTKREEKD